MSGGEALIAALEKRIADQRENGGDMLNYGTPNPLDVDLLAFIKSSPASTPPAAASEVVREALQTIASAEFVDVMCDPGWAIRIARSALDSAEVKS